MRIDNDLPLISIIIPHFNRSLLIKETIESVLGQTLDNWEIIIIDDHSDQAELEELQHFIEGEDRILLKRRNGNLKGPAVCRNQGVEYASAKYIIFLDSDDLLKSCCLENRFNYLESHNHIDWAVFLIESFRLVPGDIGLNFNLKIDKKELVACFLENNNPWQTMAPIWKRTFFDELGGFDEDLLYMEDPELHVRALSFDLARVKICYDKPVDCYYRLHHDDQTKENFYYNSIFYRILFYKKMIRHESIMVGQNSYKINIKKGILNLLNNFLYSRAGEFNELYHDFILLIRESGLFTNIEIKKIMVLTRIGNNENIVLRKIKTKGLCYRLLPK